MTDDELQSMDVSAADDLEYARDAEASRGQVDAAYLRQHAGYVRTLVAEVRRLRSRKCDMADCNTPSAILDTCQGCSSAMIQEADALRAERDRLREALKKIESAAFALHGSHSLMVEIRKTARTALAEVKP